MLELVSVVDDGRHAIESGDQAKLADLINRNFDIRSSICQLRSDHVEMVETARGVGASAKYCGSGGAIIGTYEGSEMFVRLSESLMQKNCLVFKPEFDDGKV